MRLHLLAIGQRMPAWVSDAYQEYAKRLPAHLQPRLTECPGSRHAQPQKAQRDESQRLLAALPTAAHRVALDGRGRNWTTEQLAARLADWQMQGRDLALLIGGAEGHDSSLLDACEERWSLGPLTLPHPLVRVVVIEQLYRAWTILSGHPYHRA